MGQDRRPAPASVERRALLALRVGVECLMAAFAFEWGTRLWSAFFTLVPPSGQSRVAAWSFVAFAVFWFGAFGVLFWVSTRQVEGTRPARRSLLLLALQFPLALGGSAELMLVLCFQAPLVLSGRALAWFLCVAGLSPLALSAANLAAKGFQPTPDQVTAAFRRWPPLTGWALSQLELLAWLGFAAALGWVVARAVRSWRELLRANAELRASRELLAQNARVAERLHVSRELHDVLGHHLAALIQHLELARRRSDGEAAEAVGRSRDLAVRLLERLRSAVATMRRPPTLELSRALRTLAGANAGVAAVLSLPDAVHLPPARTAALFDCACEALGSAVLAGGRPKVTLELRRKASGHVLTVSVECPRAPRASEAALGRLRERLAPLGGALETGLARGAFRMQVDLPDAEAAR